MKNYLYLFIAVLLLSSCTRIGPGYAGLKVSMAGGDKGTSRIEQIYGWEAYLPITTNIVKISTRNQHFALEQPITVQAKGGTNVLVHPSFNYQINAGKVDSLYIQWGVTDDQQIQGKLLETSLITTLREVTNTFTIDSLLNNRAAYDASLEVEMNKKLRPYAGLFQFTSGVTPDESMAAAIAEKAGSIQRAITAENKRREQSALADLAVINAKKDSSVAVITAKGQAEAIKVKQSVITPTYVEFIKWSAWDGKLPETMLGSSGALINLNGK